MKVGDKVRILDGSKNKSYCCGWAEGMYKYVGKTDIIIGSFGRGVYLEGNVFTWDARYLELVEEGKMENKIIIEGKEYELSNELVEKIRAEVEFQERHDKKNLFERNQGGQYYYVTSFWSVCADVDESTITDGGRYQAANYCHDRELMEQRALHETLNRLLWRYSETHGGGEERGGFFIYLSGGGDMYVGHCTYAGCGDVYFKTRAVAEAAIEEVVKPFMVAHPEFVW